MSLSGHPIAFTEVDADALGAPNDVLSGIYAGEHTGIIVRGAFPEALRAQSVARLGSSELAERWSAPNKGMTGGEIRVIGDAATPTFTALRGPSLERYTADAAHHDERAAAVFGADDPASAVVAERLSHLFGGRPAAPARLGSASWSPYNVRALDPGQQIYSHHDDHYGLAVYEGLDPALDRGGLLSFFVTLQAPEGGGELVVYGLRGSDPNPPMLPTRFLDTAALERDYLKHTCTLNSGDLVVFDAGRHVHRVTPVTGSKSRLTVGGFLTLSADRSRLAFWS